MEAVFKRRELKDEILRISDCMHAVSDLMLPEPDLHAVDRGKLAILLSYLNERLIDLLNKSE